METYILVKIHNFKAFRTKYGYSRLQENDVKGVWGQEEIPINSKPLRFGWPESKSRTESNGCFYPFVDLVTNGLQYAKDGFQLFKYMVKEKVKIEITSGTYSFFLHIHYKCTTLKCSDTKEVHIFRPAELLGNLRGMGTMRRWRDQSFNMISEERLQNYVQHRWSTGK